MTPVGDLEHAVVALEGSRLAVGSPGGLEGSSWLPTAKSMYILAREYKVEEPLVAATVSITTLVSVGTLLGWLYALSGVAAQVK